MLYDIKICSKTVARVQTYKVTVPGKLGRVWTEVNIITPPFLDKKDSDALPLASREERSDPDAIQETQQK